MQLTGRQLSQHFQRKNLILGIIFKSDVQPPSEGLEEPLYIPPISNAINKHFLE